MIRKKSNRAKGTGNLSKASNGKWMMRFTGADGRAMKRSTGTTDRRDAEAILSRDLQQVARIKQGLEAPSAQRTADQLSRPLREHITEYLEAFERQEARTAGTMRVRRSIFRTFLLLSKAILRRDPMLRELDSDLIERVMHKRIEEGRAPRTANTQRQYILAFAAWATNDGRGDFSRLGRMIKCRKEALDRRRERRALTLAEEMALLAAAGPRRLVYHFALSTGLRKGEIRSLTWADLDLERGLGIVRNTKAGKSDEFNLLSDLTAELRAQRPMRLRSQSRVFDRVPTHRTFRRDLERAGIAERDERGTVIDFHALRGTLGTKLALAGVPPQIAKGIMRHSTYRTTEKHYHHLTLHDERQALETALARPSIAVAEGTSGRVIEVDEKGTSCGTSSGTKQRANGIISVREIATSTRGEVRVTQTQTPSTRDYVLALARGCLSMLESRKVGTIGAVGQRSSAQVLSIKGFTQEESDEVHLAVHLRDLIAALEASGELR